MHTRILSVLSIFFATALLFLFVSSSSADAATYYVAKSGSNTNPCTQSQPCLTINHGMTKLSAGDTLYVRQGIYPESIRTNDVTIPTGTSWSNAVTIASFPNETATLQPPDSGSQMAGVVLGLAESYVQYIIFDRLVLDATGTGWGVSMTNGANHIRIQNTEIKNAKWQGILLTHGSAVNVPTYNEFINNHIHSTYHGAAGGSHCIYNTTQSNLYEGNTIHDCGKYGITVYNGNSPAQRTSNTVVRSNEIYRTGLCDNLCDGSSGGSSIGLDSGDNLAAYNNILYDQTSAISASWGSPVGVKIYNNTLYNNTSGIKVGALSSDAIVRNNIVYQSGGITNNGANTALSNNLTTDPKFVNAAGGDFYLQSTSPASLPDTFINSFSIDI